MARSGEGWRKVKGQSSSSSCSARRPLGSLSSRSSYRPPCAKLLFSILYNWANATGGEEGRRVLVIVTFLNYTKEGLTQRPMQCARSPGS